MLRPMKTYTVAVPDSAKSEGAESLVERSSKDRVDLQSHSTALQLPDN